MIKVTHRRQNPSLFASVSSLQLSKSHRHSMKLTPLVIQSENQPKTQHPTSSVIVDSNEYQKLQEILEWRLNTDFPIVKVRSYKILDDNQTIKSNLIEILVELQSKTKPLSEMSKLPFFQAIYVLKQSMIGFERLCHHFGFFTPSIDMIRFNENQHCKVWINEDCFSNSTNLGSVKSQKHFVNELCRIVESKTLKSKISAEFFDGMRTCQYFFQAICSIDNYSKSNKVIIPTKIQHLQVPISPLITTSLNYKPVFNQSNSNLIQSSKIPEFIKMKKATSYNPSVNGKRKMTACTAQISRDISLTNISRNNSTNSIQKNQFQQKNTMKNDQQLIDEDTFLKDLNIRLIEPDGKERKSNAPSTPIKKSSFYQTGRDSPSHFSTAQKLFLTPHKSANHDETYSTFPKKKLFPSPKCIKTLRYLDEHEQESFDEFQKVQIPQKKFKPLSISQIRQKRKPSVDLTVYPFKMMIQDYIQQPSSSPIPQHRTQNLLTINKNIITLDNLRKSPSHHIIPTLQNQINSQQQEQKQQEVSDSIRETIMNKNGWKGLELFADQSQMKKSLVEKEQTPRERTKTSDLLKLGGMGRAVKSSMISQTEFELQYAEQLQKQQSVRNQFLNLLD